MKHSIEQIPRIYQSNFTRLKHEYLLVQEKIRQITGKDVIFIESSDYRDPLHNKRCGGVQNSQHTKAEAIDFQPQNYDINEIYKILQEHQLELKIDQLILERDDKKPNVFWIHFSIANDGEEPRFQAFHAIKGGHVSKFQQTKNTVIDSNSSSKQVSVKNNYDTKKPFLGNLANGSNSSEAVNKLAQITSVKDLARRMAKDSNLNKLLRVASEYDSKYSKPQGKT